MKNNKKIIFKNLGSINLCFISENPWLKNFAKKNTMLSVCSTDLTDKKKV